MKKIKLLCKILASTVTISALSGCSNGISSYEKLIKQFETSINEQDSELLTQTYITDGISAYLEKEKDMDYDDILDKADDYLDDSFDNWEELCGDDVVVTIEIKDAEKIEEEKSIKKIIKAYKKEFDEEVEIKEAYRLRCRFRIKGEDESEKITEELTAVKIKNQGWKIAVAGYINDSEVTSANYTAASIKNNINTFLTIADIEGYGMLLGSSVSEQFYITVDTVNNETVWTVSAGTLSNYKVKNPTISWGDEGKGTKDTTKDGVTNAETLLAIELSQLFPEIKEASLLVSCVGGKCVAVAYTKDTNNKLEMGKDCPNIQENGEWEKGTFEWNDILTGVTNNYFIVGTSPQYTD